MSFVVTYPQASFSASAGVIQAASLVQAVQLAGAITTAIEAAFVSGYGTAAAEVFPPVGQVWSMQFAGAGPLSGPEVTALNGVVAAYTTANYVKLAISKMSDGFNLAGLSLKSLRFNAAETGIEAYVASGGGNVSNLDGFTDNAVCTFHGSATTIQTTPVIINPTTGAMSGVGTLASKAIAVTVASKQVPAISLSAGIDGFLDIQVNSVNPQGTVTANDKTLLLGSVEQSTGGGISPVLWLKNDVGSAGDGPWQPIAAGRPVLINALYNGNIVWLSANACQVTAGHAVLVDASGRAKVCSWASMNVSTLSTGTLGIDTGVVALKKWYYVYVIAKHTTGSTGQDISAVLSLSATSPTLPSGYTFYRRVGCVRTTNGSATIAQMYQVGSSNTREYWFNTTAEMVALTAGTATTQTVLGNGDTGLSLPVHARQVTMNVTTNSLSVARLRSNASITVTLVEVPISTTKMLVTIPCTAGSYYYINPSASGSTTINHLSFTADE